ncbi:MAG: T9SS type A sorting domain-containing protein, partial [Muribaculaceae bacterium]
GISPNPPTDMAIVPAPAGIASVDIYNLTGAKVAAMGFAGTETTVEAHIEGLAAGHYIMQVATADGRTSTMRLIKL